MTEKWDLIDDLKQRFTTYNNIYFIFHFLLYYLCSKKKGTSYRFKELTRFQKQHTINQRKAFHMLNSCENSGLLKYKNKYIQHVIML